MGVNALVAADALIVPVTPQHLAVEGLVSLLSSVEKVRVRLGTRGRLLGILLTMVEPVKSASAELRERLRAQYREHVFHTEIAVSRALQEAPAAAKEHLSVRPTLARGRRVPPAVGRGARAMAHDASLIPRFPNAPPRTPGLKLGVERSRAAGCTSTVELEVNYATSIE